MTNELWKPIIGYEEKYMVSNYGNILSLTYKRSDKSVLMSPSKTKKGYLRIKLSKHNKSKTHSVHKLVALAFLPNTNSELIVNHKNGKRDDNRLDNLEWVTHQENVLHGFRELGRIPTTRKQVNQYSISGEFIKTWTSAQEIANSLNLNRASIVGCCKNKRKTCNGYMWTYASH